MKNFLNWIWFFVHIPYFIWGIFQLRNMARYRKYKKIPPQTFLQKIEHRALAFLIAEDEALNTLLGPGTVPAAGNAHYTVSQRLAEMRDEGSEVGVDGCAVLTWVQNEVFRVPGDHCTIAMQGFPPDLPTQG